jgi:MFS family permease
MPESRYEVLALFAGAMVAASLFVVSTGTLMPFFQSAFGLGRAQLGAIVSVQMVGSLLATAMAGALTDRFGDKAVVLWSGWIMGLALIVAAAIHDFRWLLLWLAIYGIAFAAVTPAGSHAIVYFFKKDERGFAMGVRQCGVPLAGVVGSILLPAIALHFGYRWSLVVAGVVTIVACRLASLLYREPAELAGERVSLPEMLHEMLQISRSHQLVLVTLASMLLVCSQMVLIAFLTATLVRQTTLGVAAAVGAFTISQIGAIGGRLLWGRSSDTLFRGSRTLPLVAVATIAAGCAICVSLFDAHTAVWMVYALAAVLGFSAEGWFGLAVIAVAEIGGEEHSGSALGVALTWVFLAAFLAPILFGALAQARGYPFSWQVLAVLTLAAIVPALLAEATTRRQRDRA